MIVRDATANGVFNTQQLVLRGISAPFIEVLHFGSITEPPS